MNMTNSDYVDNLIANAKSFRKPNFWLFSIVVKGNWACPDRIFRFTVDADTEEDAWKKARSYISSTSRVKNLLPYTFGEKREVRYIPESLKKLYGRTPEEQKKPRKAMFSGKFKAKLVEA